MVWPEDDDPRPETLLYALLGPKGAYTDWHVDMGGSSVWYHLISGCKIFMLAPNTPQNNATFEKWSTSEQQASAFLGDSLEHCQRVVLRAGDTLFLPSGWPHAVSTPEDSFVLGGNFLSSLDYGSIAHVYRSEVRLGVQPKFQFPLFRRLMWHAARCAVEKIKKAKKDLELEEKKKKKKKKKKTGNELSPGSKESVPVVSKQQHRTKDGTSPAPKGTTCSKATTSPSALTTTPFLDVPQLNRWERQGLPSLLSLLKDWHKEPSAARRVDIPDEIENTDAFLEEMEQLIQELDADIALNDNDFVAGGGGGGGGGGEPLARVTAKKMKNINTSPKYGGSSDSKPLESDCGTSSSSSSDDNDDGSNDKEGDAREIMHASKLQHDRRRRPEKRTKQLASLVQLKEAFAARASKPKTSQLNSFLQHRHGFNTTTTATTTTAPAPAPHLQNSNGSTNPNVATAAIAITNRNKNMSGTSSSPMNQNNNNNNNNNNKLTVITLSSSSSESECDSEPMYISSSSSSEREEEEDAGEGFFAVRSMKKPSKAAEEATIPKKGKTAVAGGGGGVNRGLKSPVLGVRRKLQQEEKKKAHEVVYKPPVPLDVQPLGRTKQIQPLLKKKHKISTSPVAATLTNGGGAQDFPPSSERAVALEQILEMRKLEQDLHREQRLLETVAGGGVALKDSGQKLEARVLARQQQLELMKNTLEGKVLYYKDTTGRMQGPFTSRQLGVLVKAGSCPEDAAVVEKSTRGVGKASDSSVLKEKEGSSYLTIEEAITLPIPLTAVILKEESDSQAKEIGNKEEAGQPNVDMQQRQHQRQHQQEQERQQNGEDEDRGGGGGRVQKKKRSKSRSRPRKQYNEPYFSHNNKADAPQQHRQPWQQQQQKPPRPRSAEQRAGPSAWDIAAATTAAIIQQESDPIWTFKVPQTGEYKGPYCTAELRRMFESGELVEDIMVHDEEGGVSASLLTLLRVPQGSGASRRYEIEPYLVAAEHTKKQPPPQPQQQQRDEELGRFEGDVKTEKTGAAIKELSKGNNDTINEEKGEPEPYAVTIGRHFALSAPHEALPLQIPSNTQHLSSPHWGSYADPRPAQDHNRHGSYYRYERYPPPAAEYAQHAQQAPWYSHGAAPVGRSWAAPPQQQQQQPPLHHVPMSNTPRPMMRAAEVGFHHNASGGWGRNAAVPPGDNGGNLGPMRPAAQLNGNHYHYHHHQQQEQQEQSYYNPSSYKGNGNGYWTSRY